MIEKSLRRGSKECGIRQRLMKARGHHGQSLRRSAEVPQSDVTAIAADAHLGVYSQT